MKAVHTLEIQTPKGVFLNGIWHGPRKARDVYIVVHGLTGSLFSMKAMVGALVGKGSAVLTFDNRGFHQVASVKRKKRKTTSYVLAGSAHEVFTDCVDDIQGAINAAKRLGAQRIFLIGHSTGAQKVVYWAAKKKDARVRGLVLFGPLSDYAGIVKTFGTRKLARAVARARALVRAKRPHELMPEHLREWFACDAQRFLSLYTPDSREEVFTYAQKGKAPRALRSVRLPILVFLAGADEYGDRPAREIGQWFGKHLKKGDRVCIVPHVGHSFKGGEKAVTREIREFVQY